MKVKVEKRELSVTGNQTPVSRVKGRDSYHYNTSMDLLAVSGGFTKMSKKTITAINTFTYDHIMKCIKKMGGSRQLHKL